MSEDECNSSSSFLNLKSLIVDESSELSMDVIFRIDGVMYEQREVLIPLKVGDLVANKYTGQFGYVMNICSCGCGTITIRHGILMDIMSNSEPLRLLAPTFLPIESPYAVMQYN